MLHIFNQDFDISTVYWLNGNQSYRTCNQMEGDEL